MSAAAGTATGAERLSPSDAERLRAMQSAAYVARTVLYATEKYDALLAQVAAMIGGSRTEDPSTCVYSVKTETLEGKMTDALVAKIVARGFVIRHRYHDNECH